MLSYFYIEQEKSRDIWKYINEEHKKMKENELEMKEEKKPDNHPKYNNYNYWSKIEIEYCKNQLK